MDILLRCAPQVSLEKPEGEAQACVCLSLCVEHPRASPGGFLASLFLLSSLQGPSLDSVTEKESRGAYSELSTLLNRNLPHST